jgi:hypothetical protein
MRWKLGMSFVVVLLATACGTIAPLSDSERASLADPPRAIAENVAALLPGAIAYIEDTERETMRRGRPLTSDETRIARAVGVAHPEQVRVLVHDNFIEPRDPAFVALARKLGVDDDPDEGGCTAGHGIQIKPKFARSRHLLAHELTHVAQYERLGTAGLIRAYMTQLLMVGYARAPLEAEARANEGIKKKGTDKGDGGN